MLAPESQDSKVVCSLFDLSKARQIMYISSQTVFKNLLELEFMHPLHPLYAAAFLLVV